MLVAGGGAGTPGLFAAGLTGMCISSTLTLAGARSFDGRTISPLILVLGTSIWLAAIWLPVPMASVILHICVTVAYYAGAAASIAQEKGEALRARMPLAVLLSVHALTLMLAVPATLTMELLPGEPPSVLSWFGIIHFETLVFAIGTAIFMIIMMKERNEGRLITTLNTDPLTGVANRRGFFKLAERVLERCHYDAAPVAVAMFDLDRFKSINDNFGHAAGDRVLQMFVEVSAKVLRPGDLLGRLGGEEFAVVMPGSGIEAGHAMAERVRKAFAEAGSLTTEAGGEAFGSMIRATTSGGVASSQSAADIHALLREADAGLYRAKSLGRNRIERSFEAGSDATASIIRIA
jgi:diguanylate cyclase (GGDEF)-like protein